MKDMKALVWILVVVLGIASFISMSLSMYDEWYEYKGKYQVKEGSYQHLYIGGYDVNNRDSMFIYKESAISATLKLISIPRGEWKAVLTTDFKWNKNEWVEVGVFNGKGKFIFNNETHGSSSIDTCNYHVTKKDVLVIDDKNGKLALSKLLKAMEEGGPRENYTSIYLLKKEK